jgi:hypothetical protein
MVKKNDLFVCYLLLSKSFFLKNTEGYAFCF